MRIRTVKPEFWTSLTVAALPVPARLTFIGLWNYCDDDGRGADDARLIRAAIWPLDSSVTEKRISVWLGLLADAGLIQRYQESGRSYLCITNWSEHQRVEKPKASPIPPPPFPDGSPTLPGTVPDSSPLYRKGREQGTGNREGNGTSGRDELFESLAESCGIDWHHLTPSARGELNAALKALREAGDATPDEVRFRVGAYVATYPTAALTPSAVAKHWPALANGSRARAPTAPADRLLRQEQELQRREEANGAGKRGDTAGTSPSRGLPSPGLV